LRKHKATRAGGSTAAQAAANTYCASTVAMASLDTSYTLVALGCGVIVDILAQRSTFRMGVGDEVG
jgi:hypothetical protein